MISEKRLLANRANGALSRGPVTPEGKSRSARNSTRHGLLAKCVVLRNENREAFQELLDLYIERFGPIDEVELGLIEEMVSAYWRLRRALAIEMNMFDLEMDQHSGAELDRLTSSFAGLSASPKFNLMYRYQTRLHLMHSRALRDLAIMRRLLPSADPAIPNEPNNSLLSNDATTPILPDPAESSSICCKLHRQLLCLTSQIRTPLP
jgi:hypothetical protein